MPAPIQITLNPEEDRTLTELRVAQTVPQRTLLSRPCAAAECSFFGRFLRLPRSLTVMSIRCGQQFNVGAPWGLGGLWEAPGRGTKRKWQDADMQYLEKWRFAGSADVQ